MFERPPTPEAKLPVTLITGFLGSGKTTLLNAILKRFSKGRVAVLVNEFGDINIDSQLLIAVDEDVIELTNGCICCTINNNLSEAVFRILAHRDRIDHLIVETTGLADPLPIATAFLATELWNFTRVDAILTVVDAEAFTPEHFGSEIAFRQVAYSDMILLNKTDLVTEAALEALERFLQTVKPNPKIVRMAYGQVPLPLILDTRLYDSSFCATSLEVDRSKAVNQPENDGYMAVSFESDRPISLRKFQQFLDYQLPKEIFRGKGILRIENSPDRHVFQLSGKRINIDSSEWNTPPKTQLVWIGRNLNPLNLQQLLTNCLGTTL
ncbi:MAG: GTP-binding protein [Acaryochloridaceae cyanobacterium RU_4_10]|nr:GTP-binding protein [Acaryochloridaceae cyanobacterium RU_4_10]